MFILVPLAVGSEAGKFGASLEKCLCTQNTRASGARVLSAFFIDRAGGGDCVACFVVSTKETTVSIRALADLTG